ncbi:MAG: zinc ribbon domain-containing protein [Capsulimonadales bacterium]|nr:zinc ribbon domain-containing protein [Capsulimonadales bacterium]
MPTYGYRCSSCGLEFERFRKMTDPPITDCECGATGTVRKRIYPVGIAFKGSGFYINDYARTGNGSSSRAAESDAAETKSASKSETSADTTSGAKTETGTETAAPVASAAPANKT